MGYKIGVDFGTTNSTVAYVDGGNEPMAFRYPGPDGADYIPSCVAYESDGTVRIGRAALGLAGDPDVVFCNNFKMILPQPPDKQGEYEWTRSRAPADVVADYLRHLILLTDEDGSSFVTERGEIDGVVLSVPHVWDREILHAGRTRLMAIAEETLKLPSVHLVSEPVAAAAYYAYRHRMDHATSFSGNVLICDMGGGTFDVTLCRVSPGCVEELHNDGNGRMALGRAGVRFDRRLIADGLRREGRPVDENDPEFAELYVKLQEYKVNNHADITKRIRTAIEDPDRREAPILRAGRMKFDFNQIGEAFEEIRSGVHNVLERIAAAISEKGHGVDAIYFVGGFSQFFLVRRTIVDFWRDRLDADRLGQRDNQSATRFAISYGAALIANDMIQVEEKFEHTLGIEGYRLVPSGDAFTKETCRIPILAGGGKLSGYERIHFAECPVKADNESPDVTIFVDKDSSGRIIQERLPRRLGIKLPNAATPGNLWRVGMRINRSKVIYLIFEDKAGVKAEYELGDILRRMFGGLEFVTEEAP